MTSHPHFRGVLLQLWALLLWLAWPASMQAQFSIATNNGAIEIARYLGPGGAVTIPSTINGLPVTRIGDAFEGTRVTTVILPDSVTNILDYAFHACCSLTNVTLGNGLTYIGSWAFDSCTALSSITIPDSVTFIGMRAFLSCTNLTTVTLPRSLQTLGTSAFEGCCRLSSVSIPQGVTIIWNSTFGGCTSLASVSLPQSVDTVDIAAFADCTSLTNVTFGDNLRTLDMVAFANCTSLTSVTLPRTLTKIAWVAFSNCPNLTRVQFLGNAPTTVDAAAFAGSTNAVVFYLPGTTGWDSTLASCPTGLWQPAIRSTESGFGGDPGGFRFSVDWGKDMLLVTDACTNLSAPFWLPLQTNVMRSEPSLFTDAQRNAYPNRYYRLRWLPTDTADYTCSLSNGSLTITRYTGSNAAVSIPATIHGVPVAAIGFGAFAGCDALRTVTIPDSVTAIGQWAFAYCTNLLDATIGNGVARLDWFAFTGCSSLTNLAMGEGVASIGYSALSGCTNLSSLTLPATVTNIESMAFAPGTNLTSLYFKGDAPHIETPLFGYGDSPKPTVFYLPGTAGWGPTLDGCQTALWLPAGQFGSPTQDGSTSQTTAPIPPPLQGNSRAGGSAYLTVP